MTVLSQPITRVCPAHLEPINDELVCAYCIDPRTSWLVVDAQGQVVAAGRIHRWREKRTDCVWLSDSLDDPKDLLNELARRHGQDPRQERELAEVPWGDR